MTSPLRGFSLETTQIQGLTAWLHDPAPPGPRSSGVTQMRVDLERNPQR